MPTYSYKCTECATAFDIQQAFTDDSLTVCPNCGGKLRKVFSAVGVTFNGSGFYRNDSRSKASDAKSSESKSSESKSGDSKTSESKASDSKSGESKTSPAKPAASASSTPAASSSKAAG